MEWKSEAVGGFYSFGKLLRKTMQSLKSNPLILEWGPGFSTLIMLEEKPESSIYTFEHDPHWYSVYAKRFKDFPKVKIYHQPDLDGGYLNKPLKMGYKFDLIFIDGRNRVKCCEVAKEVLAEGGLVMLHDANRGEYRKGRDLFKLIVDEGDTILMGLKNED